MLNIGGGELLIILLAALIFLGPQRLPEVARQVGQTVNTLRGIARGFQSELEAAARPDVPTPDPKPTSAAELIASRGGKIDPMYESKLNSDTDSPDSAESGSADSDSEESESGDADSGEAGQGGEAVTGDGDDEDASGTNAQTETEADSDRSSLAKPTVKPGTDPFVVARHARIGKPKQASSNGATETTGDSETTRADRSISPVDPGGPTDLSTGPAASDPDSGPGTK